MPPRRPAHLVKTLGLLGGPLVALALALLLPDAYVDATGSEVAFGAAGRATVAAMGWMGVWWLTEAIDISATALLPLVLFPLLGIAGIKDAAAPYADPNIFLFMGGFLLALSMQRWGLDQRIALITLRLVGTRPANMVAGFMLATAVLSAFVSNTATTAMMLPVALSVIALVEGAGTPGPGGRAETFARCLMLGLAYAASIGGVATIIGTPPNVLLVAFLEDGIAEPYRAPISFVQWLGIGVPVTAVMLPLTWLLLTRVLHPIRISEIEGGRELIEQRLRALGRPNRGEILTLVAFSLTALGWMSKPLLVGLEIGGTAPLASLTDAGIAMTGAMLLFVLPSGDPERRFVMDWNTARGLPWGILILFGGGLSLAHAVQVNGVGELVGSLTRGFESAPDLVVIIAVTAGVVFLTELTSNVATTATLVPILAAIAPGLGLHPYELIFPATIAASCAFMMPVATPPNAIVFASGRLTIPQMCSTGVWLNVLSIAVITVLSRVVMMPLLGVAGPAP